MGTSGVGEGRSGDELRTPVPFLFRTWKRGMRDMRWLRGACRSAMEYKPASGQATLITCPFRESFRITKFIVETGKHGPYFSYSIG